MLSSLLGNKSSIVKKRQTLSQSCLVTLLSIAFIKKAFIGQTLTRHCIILASKIVQILTQKQKSEHKVFRFIQKQPPKVFYVKGVLRNFKKFTGKHLCQNLFFNKVAALRPATLLKKRLWHRCFPVSFVKFLRTPFFTEGLWTASSNNHLDLCGDLSCNSKY